MRTFAEEERTNMSSLQIAALAYGLATLIYLVPTYIEGEKAGGQWSVHRIAGLVFCAFWPLLTAVFIYTVVLGASKPKFVFVDPAVATQCNAATLPRD